MGASGRAELGRGVPKVGGEVGSELCSQAGEAFGEDGEDRWLWAVGGRRLAGGEWAVESGR